jgi:hypothetical protein
VPIRPETVATSVQSTDDALTARFSPDVVRRAGAVLGRIVGPRLLGPGQRMRASQFATLGATPGHIVFLGDSITQGGLWPEWFPGVPVLNRGIDGETSEDLLRRVDSAVRDPRAVFLLIGTNDLSIGFSLQRITGNVRALLAAIERPARADSATISDCSTARTGSWSTARGRTRSTWISGPRWRTKTAICEASSPRTAFI